MKKILLALAAGITIFVFLYKIGEDMMSMTRCGYHGK